MIGRLQDWNSEIILYKNARTLTAVVETVNNILLILRPSRSNIMPRKILELYHV